MIFLGDKDYTPWFHQSKKPKHEGWYMVCDSRAQFGDSIYLPSTRGPQEVALPDDCAWRYWHSTRGWMWCNEDGKWHVGASVLSPWRGLRETLHFKPAEFVMLGKYKVYSDDNLQ